MLQTSPIAEVDVAGEGEAVGFSLRLMRVAVLQTAAHQCCDKVLPEDRQSCNETRGVFESVSELQ